MKPYPLIVLDAGADIIARRWTGHFEVGFQGTPVGALDYKRGVIDVEAIRGIWSIGLDPQNPDWTGRSILVDGAIEEALEEARQRLLAGDASRRLTGMRPYARRR